MDSLWHGAVTFAKCSHLSTILSIIVTLVYFFLFSYISISAYFLFVFIIAGEDYDQINIFTLTLCGKREWVRKKKKSNATRLGPDIFANWCVINYKKVDIKKTNTYGDWIFFFILLPEKDVRLGVRIGLNRWSYFIVKKIDTMRFLIKIFFKSLPFFVSYDHDTKNKTKFFCFRFTYGQWLNTKLQLITEITNNKWGVIQLFLTRRTVHIQFL